MKPDFEYLKELLASKKMSDLWNEAEAYCRRGDALRWFRERSEAGDHQAQYILHILYREQNESERNMDEAFFWCRKAAEGGIIPAQKDLSYYYDKGIGTEQDDARAAYWLKTAAAKGDPTALCMLGRAYNGGRHGLERDHEKAVECFYWAAMRGNRLARLWIGQAYLEGDVFPQDEEEAMKFLRAAANDGLDTAAYVAAVYYREKGDDAQAEEWYRKSLEITKNEPGDPMNLQGASEERIDALVENFLFSTIEEEEEKLENASEEQIGGLMEGILASVADDDEAALQELQDRKRDNAEEEDDDEEEEE